jgi:tetratricopeptide (TPR) repeat protein
VQLIRAATDDHLWAEVYNRKLDDIFAVEAEVAGAIAEALNAKLTGAEQNAVAERPTANLAAYDAFLQGRTLSLAGYDYATSRKAAAAYAEAVRLDPDFAVAWADLGRVAGYLYFNGVDTDVYTAAYVKHASDQAIGLQPQLVEAQLSHANYLYRIERNFAAAAKVLDGIVASAPNNNEAWQFRGLVVRRQGLWKEALADLEKAAELDPRNAGLMTAIGGETLLNLRRYDEARQWLERALSISPGNALVTGYLISSYQTEGRLTDAARLIDTIPAAGIDPFVAFSRVQQRLFERRFDVAIVELDPVLARNDPSLDGQRPLLTLNRALALRAAGKKDAARATLEPLVASLAPDAERVDDTLLPLLQARALAYLGRDAEAIAQARRAVELFRDDGIDAPQAQQTLAEVLALSGDHAGAIAILESVVDKPVGLSPALLRLDPIWDPLRGEPRFDALAARPDKPAL